MAVESRRVPVRPILADVVAEALTESIDREKCALDQMKLDRRNIPAEWSPLEQAAYVLGLRQAFAIITNPELYID